MSNLFISYGGDESALAKELEKRLLAKGHRIRIPVDAAVAGTWRRKYSEALAASDVLIVVVGKAAIASKNVLGEIGAGRVLEQGRGLLMLPVLLPDMPIPDFISDIYCFRLKGAAGSDFDAAVDELDQAIADKVRSAPRIFISHRHRDKAIAAALTKLLEQAFEIDSNALRCTSVPPYMLTPGERTSERLRSDIAAAELVIGILTPDSSESDYVLCELGASWGRDVATFPVLARGATVAHVPPPLNERHSLSLETDENCLQLIDFVASKTTLGRRDQSASDLGRSAAALAREAKSQLNVKSDWEHSYADTYTGQVWTKLQTFDDPKSTMYRVFLRWGRFVYVCELPIPPNSHVYLTHDRTKPELVPIQVQVSPPCQVIFGKGVLPNNDSPKFDIRRGWQEIQHPAGG